MSFCLLLIPIAWPLLSAVGKDAAEIAKSGASEISARQFTSARDLLERGVRSFPGSANLWNLLGIADAELNQTGEARHAFERGLKIAPRSVSLNENLGLLFVKNADYAQSKPYLERAVELGSTQAAVRFSLAAAQLRTGEQAKALAQLETLETALSGVAGYWEERGRAMLLTDPHRAEIFFERALELQPTDLVALNGAAQAAEAQRLEEKALADLIRARSISPDDVETLSHFGALCIRRDLGPDAVQALERAHHLAPNNNSVLFLLARANISIQSWQRAYDLFNEFSARIPNYAPAHYAKGWVAIRLNRLDDARRELERALALEPGMVDARYELGQLEVDSGEFDSAKRLLNEVLNGNPNHAKANVAMADILLREGDLNGAQAHLEKAIAQDQSFAAAHYKLSSVLLRKHDKERGERERALATQLEADAKRASRTQLKLVLPDAGPTP